MSPAEVWSSGAVRSGRLREVGVRADALRGGSARSMLSAKARARELAQRVADRDARVGVGVARARRVGARQGRHARSVAQARSARARRDVEQRRVGEPRAQRATARAP
jgi:hypothetical protein